jgi:hypothetical protein
MQQKAKLNIWRTVKIGGRKPMDIITAVQISSQSG